jgi:hypothetical protein
LAKLRKQHRMQAAPDALGLPEQVHRLGRPVGAAFGRAEVEGLGVAAVLGMPRPPVTGDLAAIATIQREHDTVIGLPALSVDIPECV